MDKNRRSFFKDLLEQGAKTVSAFKEGQEEARRRREQEEFFKTYDSSYALTLCEGELVLESAQRAGIDTDGREKKDIAKELFVKSGQLD